MSHKQSIEYLVHILRDAGDAEISKGMAAYMKNHFVFFGVKKPEREALTKSWIQERKKLPYADLEEIVLLLWDQPQREMQYIAIELMKASKIFRQEDSLTLLEKVITSKSWWDTVDLIASGMVGGYFLQFPERKTEVALEWCNGKDLWLQRTSIIFQLTYRSRTDEDLLMSTILTHLESREFFLRKAMGWALRQYARTNPDFVIQFVNAHSFSGLTVREALKHLNK